METPEPSEILFTLKLAKGRQLETLLLAEDRLVEDGSVGERPTGAPRHTSRTASAAQRTVATSRRG
jgi:hypothetical protein